MSLQEAIKELKEQLAEEEKKESAEVESEEVEAEPEAEAEPVEEKPEEEVKEEPKPEEEVKPAPEAAPAEEKLDNSAYARMRREAAAAKKKAEDAEIRRIAAETELATLKNPTAETEERHTQLDPEMQEMVQARRMERAEKEFMSLEEKFRANNAGYDAVSKEYSLALAQSIKIQNPRLTSMEVAEKTKRELLKKAANYMADGFDPIEELYEEAKSLGFSGKSFQRQEPAQEKVEEKEIRPDMKKVAANRARSTGMAGASGRSEGQLTKQAAADLTVAEWAKLPAAEKRRLLYG